MGVCLGLATLSDDDRAQVLAHPPLVWKVIAPDDPEAYAEATRDRRGFLGRLLGGAGAPPEPGKLSGDQREHADLDKAWHGLHYLLTGSADEGQGPLAFLMAGGLPVGDLEVGYGPARVLSAAEVREVARALEPVDAAALRARFDPGAMMAAGVYPEIWDRDPAEDDPLGYCLESFEDLKRFVGRAAQRGVGLVLYFT